jgi:hypothetical protein
LVTNFPLETKTQNNPQGGKKTAGLARPLQEEREEEKEEKKMGMQSEKTLAVAQYATRWA